MYVWLLWIKEAFVGLFRNFWWNSIAFGLSLVCLIAFLFSYSAGKNAEHFSTLLNERMEIQVDLKENVVNYEEIEKVLLSDTRVKEVNFVSKEEAIEIVRTEMGSDADVLDLFEENIFPARFIVSLNNVEEIALLANDIEKMGISERVLYGEQFLDRLLQITDNIKKLGFLATIIGSIFTIFLVMVAIRMNIEQRREEIRIKKLIGSGSLTIRMPFVLEALFLMMIASLSSFFLFSYLYIRIEEFISSQIPYLTMLDDKIMLETLTLPLFGLALTIGFFGSFISTNRNVKKY